MKYNNQNIITSSDVTMLGSNIGKTLEEVVENLQTDNSSLKSNLKWIYEYGGVGGSGGGGSSSDKWSTIIDIDGKPISEDGTSVLTFKEPGYKNIYIHINNPGSDRFIVEYTYDNGNASYRIELNQDNKWIFRGKVLFLNNSSISISVMDGNAVEKKYLAKYIVNAYSFTPSLVDENNNEYNYLLVNNVKRYNIFIDEINQKGLKYVLEYNSYVNKLVTCLYSIFNSSTVKSKNVDIIDGDHKKKLLEEDAIGNVGNITDDQASNYTFNCTLIIDGEESDFSLTADLLPNSLYLKVQPQDSSVILYKSTDVLDYKKYINGNKTFIVTPYEGYNPDFGPVTCTYYINDSDLGDKDFIDPTTSILKTFIFSLEGWNKITFVAEKNNQSVSFDYYIYIEYATENIEWYDKTPVDSAFYRYGIQTLDLLIDNSLVNYNLYITKNVNQSNPTIIKWDKSFDTKSNLIVNVGILYNLINNIENQILKILNSNSDNESSTQGIDLYLNSLTLNGADIGGNRFYIEKESNYNKSNNDNYHLISIVFRYIRQSNDGISNKYECSVYIDGVLQATSSNHYPMIPKLNEFILYNNNYSINLLEISYFDNLILSLDSDNYLSDADVVRYWWAYLSKILNNISDISNKNVLLNIFDNIKLEKSDDELINGHVYLNNDGINNLAKNIKVPILCIEYSPEANSQLLFFRWSEQVYDENVSHDWTTLKVGVSWANQSELREINTSNIKYLDKDVVLNIDVLFVLDILGSTTKKYKSKNYELGIECSSDPTGGIAVPIFTPFFDIDNKNTFLPETSFTLKADIVDSSHTNNTCMAKFINDNTALFEDAKQKNSVYSNHIKNCLLGFPVLLFIHSTNIELTDKYYYLGIYNFNLGRSSYFNLGYCDLTILPTLETSNDIKIYTVSGTSNKLKLKDSIIVAEIDNNEDWYDFSQSDNSILFEIDEGDNMFMFSEIVPDVNASKTAISNFVSKTTRAGLYVFDKIEKGFNNPYYDENNNWNYTDYTTAKGYVPNGRIQYTKVFNGKDYVLLPKGEIPEADALDLINFMYPLIDELIPAYCNYLSLVEYYTICMTFGLLDSVLKNLNIKSWNGGNTFYFAFYDMDTCLGVNNDGNKVAYYAFSDYWENIESEPDDDGVKFLQPVEVCRDYSISGSDMYDVPSNYAFAVAKYAKSILKAYNLINPESQIIESDIITPQNIWATWRKANGKLESADHFINTYYNGYMDGVNELMFNYNYRAKYLIERNKNGYDLDERKRFNGRNIGYVKDWMDSRIHILDAYFNLNAIDNLAINDGANYEDYVINNLNPNYLTVYESYPIDTFNLSDDVNINKSIFGNTKSFSGNIELIILAPDYTPLVIVGLEGKLNRYLFKDSNLKYKFHFDAKNRKYMFGGSYSWTYLNDINTIANGSVQIDSNKLTVLRGTSGNATMWELNMPALLEVELISADYGGELEFNGYSTEKLFENLNSINISGSKISLIVKLENVSYINCSNINSNKLTITGCYNLNTVLLNSARISECALLPVSWIEENGTFTLNKTNITNLLVKSEKNLKLVISNDDSLSQLNVNGFSEITVTNCPNLNRIVSSGNSLTKISVTKSLKLLYVELSINKDCKEIIIDGSINLTDLILIGNTSGILKLNLRKSNITGIKSSSLDDIPSMLDLTSFTSLSDFWMDENKEVLYIKFRNDFNNPVPIKHSFVGCTKLTRIYGYLEISSTNETFKELSNFSILGNDSKWKGYNRISNNIVQLPIKLVASVTPNDSHLEIIEKLDNVTLLDMFVLGNDVTNIRFSLSIAGDFSGFLKGTNTSLFEIYYILNILGLSSTNNTGIKDGAFYSKNTMFTLSSGNFDRYTFYKCGCITTISGGSTPIFRTSSSILYSPSIDEFGDVIEDNGLFSPLYKLNTLSYFSEGLNYFNRYLLRRKNDSNYPITKISYFFVELIYDDIENLSSLSNVILHAITNNKIQGLGNIEDFFKNCPDITEISHSFYKMEVLNYNTLSFYPLVNLNSMYDAFRSTYGIGKFIWENVFDPTVNYSKLETLAYSFNISSVNSSLQEERVEFELYEDMFNNMKNIKHIGYRYFDLYSSHRLGGFTTNLYDSVSFSTSFGFSGFNKKLRDNIFPYNIVSGLTNLIDFVGFFSGVNSNCDVEFPGDMFKNNTNLLNIAGLFYNSRFNKITLTSNGFINCPNLTNVTRLFYNTVLDTNSRLPGSLSGLIPYRFFFTGYDSSLPKTYKGTDNELVMNEDMEYMRTKEGSAPVLESYTVTSKLPNKSILYATECFYGLCSLESYKWNEGWDGIEDKSEFINSSYIPFKYYKVNNQWIKRIDDPLYTCKYDMSNIYDGDPEHLVEGVYCKDSQAITVNNRKGELKINDKHYFCSPDLFYNFMNSTLLSVLGMFKYCGRGSTYYSINKNYKNDFSGRICPYLFNNISKVLNLTSFFEYFTGISSYFYDGVEYIFPPQLFSSTENLTMLCNTFAGMYFYTVPNYLFLKILSSSRKNLDVRGIFSMCKYHSNFEISSVFDNLKLYNFSGAFCCRPVELLSDTSTNGGVSVSKGDGPYNETKGCTFTNIFSRINNPNSVNSNMTYFTFYKNGGTEKVVEDNAHINTIMLINYNIR